MKSVALGPNILFRQQIVAIAGTPAASTPFSPATIEGVTGMHATLTSLPTLPVALEPRRDELADDLTSLHQAIAGELEEPETLAAWLARMEGEISAFLEEAQRETPVPKRQEVLTSGTWEIKVGDSVYHRLYGPVDVRGIRFSRESPFIQLGWRQGSPISIPFEREHFARRHTNEAKSFLAATLQELASFPQIVGVAYLVRFLHRYEMLLRDLPGSVGLQMNAEPVQNIVKGYFVQGILHYFADPAHIQDPILETSWPFDAVMEKTLRRIYETTGDDVVRLGIRYFRDVLMLADATAEVGASADEREARTTVLSSTRNWYPILKRLRETIDDVALSTLYSLEARQRFDPVVYLENHDGDEETELVDGAKPESRLRYFALRAHHPLAIRYWALKMAERIYNDEKLRDIDLIVPIPGSERQGWPIRSLARGVSLLTDIPVIDDAWLPRPDDMLDSAWGLRLWVKEDQAERAYHLRPEVLDPARSPFAGKRVVTIDDNETSGATGRAVAGMLRQAGAREVKRLVATRTMREAWLREFKRAS